MYSSHQSLTYYYINHMYMLVGLMDEYLYMHEVFTVKAHNQ